MMIRLSGIIGGSETWCIREDAPRGGFIGDCLSYAFLAKYEPKTNHVYPVLTLGLTWYKGNSEFVDPILSGLRPALQRFGCTLRDHWEENGHCCEVWYYPSYSANDIVRKLETIAGYLSWKKVATGWWPKDY